MKKGKGETLKFLITILLYIDDNKIKAPWTRAKYKYLAIVFKCDPKTIYRNIKVITDLNLIPKVKQFRQFDVEHKKAVNFNLRQKENTKRGQDFLTEVFKQIK